jgi:hypothetical protein
MASITFREVEGSSLKYWLLFGALGLFVLFGALSWNYMHHYGHVVTGMDNQIVWGLPHVFAVFLIVAASGALNVASIASVFNKPDVQAAGAAVGDPRAGADVGWLAGAGTRPWALGPPHRGDDALQLQVDVHLERVPLFRLFRSGGRVPVDDAGPQRQVLLQGGWHRGLHLAPGADHRYRIPVRLPDRT